MRLIAESVSIITPRTRVCAFYKTPLVCYENPDPIWSIHLPDWQYVRKQPIIALYFESETVLKLYNLEA